MIMKDLGVASFITVMLMLFSSVYTATQYPMHTNQSSSLLLGTETILRFEPKEISIRNGETFTIKVEIVNLKENLWGFEIGLKFDRTLIEYVGAKFPSWMFVSGKIGWLFWVAGITPQSEDQTLLNLTFRSKAPGETTLSFYAHKLATDKYIESIHSFVGWPIKHETSMAVVKISNS